jgi:predicted Zn-dependent protease
LLLSLALGLTLLVAACATAPYTGRRQVMMVSEKSEVATGDQTFDELLSHYRTSPDPALNDLVNRVGGRLARAANRTEYHWEFLVLENDPEANAFCVPGGKVAIFTGIFKFTRDEGGLATVLAHEMAHSLAHHTAERQSQARLASMSGLGVGLGLGGVGGVAGQAIGEGYSLGIRYGILRPYSQAQEMEADKIGLILMAQAGYEPGLALDFWRRMMTDEDVKLRPPEFLTTHPRDDRRMQAMVDYLPEARKHYIPVVARPPKPAPPPEVTPPAPVQPTPPPAAVPPAAVEPSAAPAPPAPEAAPVPQPAPTPAPDLDSAPHDQELKPKENPS